MLNGPGHQTTGPGRARQCGGVRIPCGGQQAWKQELRAPAASPPAPPPLLSEDPMLFRGGWQWRGAVLGGYRVLQAAPARVGGLSASGGSLNWD